MKSTKRSSHTNEQILRVNLRPFFIVGILLILFISPFMRGLFFQPELLTVQIIIALVFALALYDQILRHEIANIKIEPLDMAVAALVLAYLLSLITAVHIRPAVGEMLKVLAYLMVYYVAFRMVSSGIKKHRPRDREGLIAHTESNFDLLMVVTYCAALGVALIGLGAAVDLVNYPGAFVNGVINSTLQYRNSTAAYLLVMAVIGLGLSVKTEKLYVKCLCAAGNFALLTVVISSQSRGGWILLPIAFTLLFVGLPRDTRWKTIYHFLLVAGPSLYIMKDFLPAILQGDGAGVRLLLLAGATAAILLQVIYHFVAQRIDEWDEEEQIIAKIINVGGIGFIAVTIAAYLFYASYAFPTAFAAFLPEQLAGRAETILMQDTTLADRVIFTQDALRIVKDYPLIGAGGGGWDALYHQYQHVLYWSTEVHNYFAQVWVEAGTVGFAAVMAIMATFAHTIYRLWKRMERNGLWISVWTVFVAVTALFIHSLFDFDLSLAALGILLWGLMGAVRGSIVTVKPVKHSKKIETRTYLIWFALSTFVAGLLFVPSVTFYKAGKIGALGARAITNKDYNLAKYHLEKAVRLDPLTPSYRVDLAQIYGVEALERDDAVKRFQAYRYAREAVARERFNPTIQGAAFNLYMMLDNQDGAVTQAEEILQGNPLMSANYELVAGAYMSAVIHYIETGDKDKAQDYLNAILDLHKSLKDKIAYIQSLEGKENKMSKRYPLTVTDEFTFAVGQAEFIQGNYHTALSHFNSIRNNKRLADELEIWEAAVLYKTGVIGEVNEAIKDKFSYIIGLPIS